MRADSGVVEADKAAVETAEINLGYTRIVSPVSGRVGLHLVDVGNIVQAGQATGIVVVTELSPMSVIFTVPEDNVSQIMGRVSKGAVLEADAWDRSQTTKIASGKLATVDNVVDPTTGTVKLGPCSTIRTASSSPTSSSISGFWSTRCRTRPWCRWRRSSGAPTAPLSSSSIPTRR